MVREGLKNVAAGANPMSLKKGIEAAVEAAVASLVDLSKPADTKEQNCPKWRRSPPQTTRSVR